MVARLRVEVREPKPTRSRGWARSGRTPDAPHRQGRAEPAEAEAPASARPTKKGSAEERARYASVPCAEPEPCSCSSETRYAVAADEVERERRGIGPVERGVRQEARIVGHEHEAAAPRTLEREGRPARLATVRHASPSGASNTSGRVSSSDARPARRAGPRGAGCGRGRLRVTVGRLLEDARRDREARQLRRGLDLPREEHHRGAAASIQRAKAAPGERRRGQLPTASRPAPATEPGGLDPPERPPGLEPLQAGEAARDRQAGLGEDVS